MRTIELEKYNDCWSGEFQREVELIKAALSGNLIRACHIGSTAIKGCCAKPVIDIILEVVSLGEIDQTSHLFEVLGYEVKGEFGIARRRFFQKGGDSRTHHLHIFESGDLEIERHLLVVEFMNAHPDKMAEYSALKIRLSQKYREFPEKYAAGKVLFINRIERAATAWKAS
ncbi:MAG: GrpB family protein [Gammaproteobacteria bacterium]|nr:GrpB family protein [Gammaproteobacteria bacterium]